MNQTVTEELEQVDGRSGLTLFWCAPYEVRITERGCRLRQVREATTQQTDGRCASCPQAVPLTESNLEEIQAFEGMAPYLVRRKRDNNSSALRKRKRNWSTEVFRTAEDVRRDFEEADEGAAPIKSPSDIEKAFLSLIEKHEKKSPKSPPPTEQPSLQEKVSSKPKRRPATKPKKASSKKVPSKKRSQEKMQLKECTMPGCSNYQRKPGCPLCNRHYMIEWRKRKGEYQEGICTAPGCNQKQAPYGKLGLCRKHGSLVGSQKTGQIAKTRAANQPKKA